METGCLLLICKITQETIRIKRAYFEIKTINGNLCFGFYFYYPNHKEGSHIEYVERYGNPYWSQTPNLTKDNLEYLLEQIKERNV